MPRIRLLARFALLFFVALAAAPSALAQNLTVRFFDVGHGDSALIVSPTNKTVLVDAGPPDAAASLARRVARLVDGPIDLMVMTHAHADHLGGFTRVLEEVGARLFMDPGVDHATALYSDLLGALERKQVPLRRGEAGRTIDLGGGARLHVLAPSRPFIEGSRSDVNANSIVLRLVYGETAFLLAADAEQETELRLLAQDQPLKANVYKVAHHGSRHSTSARLLEAVRPEVAVLFVAAANEYGHPHTETLARLEERGVRVYRTDRDGEITAVSDGKTVQVSTSRAVSPKLLPEAAGVESRAPASVEGPFVSSRRSAVFHRPECAGAKTIKAQNRIVHPSREAALKAGKRPAADCRP